MLKILRESETNNLDDIATSGESWLQHTAAYSKMFTRSAAYVIPRTRQAVGAKTMITVFFTAKKLIVYDVLPRGSIFNQLYFINHIPGFENRKPEFSASEDRVNFLGAHG
jgi:hypothetical protein